MPTARFYLLVLLIYSTSTLARFDRIRCIPTYVRPSPLKTPLTLSHCRAALLNSIAIKHPLSPSSDFHFRLPRTLSAENCFVRIERDDEYGIYSIDPASATRMYENTLRITESIVGKCFEGRQDWAGGTRILEGTAVTSSWLNREGRFFDYRVVVGLR